MKQFSLLLWAVFFSIPSFSQNINVIPTLFSAFRVESESQTLGFGGINTVTPSHGFSTYSFDNPSLFVKSKHRWNINGNHTARKPFLDTHIDYQQYQISYKIDKKQAIALHGKYFQIRDVELFNTGDTVNLPTTKNGISYARRLNKHWSIGANINHTYENLHVQKVFPDDYAPISTLNIGFGTNYDNTLQFNNGLKLHYQFGLSVNNLGPKASHYIHHETKNFQPTMLSFGGLVTIPVIINANHLHISLAYQVDKLLVPTPDSTDNNSNGIADYAEYSVIDGAISSFFDAPNGRTEKRQERMHRIGVEILYHRNDFMIALRGGIFLEAPNKGDRQLIMLGTSLGFKNYMLNLGFFNIINRQIPPLAGYSLGLNVKI